MNSNDSPKHSLRLVSPPPPEDDATLFRSAAVAGSQSQWLGSVILAPSMTRRVFTIFAVLTMLALLSLLYWGEYTRKENVKGWLVPDRGLIRIFAPQSSTVTSVNVADGQDVHEGVTMLALSTERQSATLGATQQEVGRQLRARRESLGNERVLKEQIHARELASLRERLNSLVLDQKAREQELAAQQRRVDLASATYKRLEPLYKQGIIAAIQMEQLEDDRLDRLARLKVLERESAAAAQDRATLAVQLKELPLKQQSELAELDRSIAGLDQELAGVEAQRELVIAAPQSGTVTAMQVKRGSSASPTVPLLSIIPSGSVLEAELFVPSRARGFIHPGQRVLLRYQAFPYQKFGLFVGSVVSISRSALSPDELARERAGAIGVREQSEPVYQVKVQLERQSVSAYGKSFSLQPGMQLEADIEIEHRRLIEWVLDPLYSLSGRQTA